MSKGDSPLKDRALRLFVLKYTVKGMRASFIIALFLLIAPPLSLSASSDPLNLPSELEVVINPPEGRLFNREAPSKYLVRIGDNLRLEGRLSGQKSLVAIPRSAEIENSPWEVSISYFHCDKSGVSQCVRVSQSRLVPLAEIRNFRSGRFALHFE